MAKGTCDWLKAAAGRMSTTESRETPNMRNMRAFQPASQTFSRTIVGSS